MERLDVSVSGEEVKFQNEEGIAITRNFTCKPVRKNLNKFLDLLFVDTDVGETFSVSPVLHLQL